MPQHSEPMAEGSCGDRTVDRRSSRCPERSDIQRRIGRSDGTQPWSQTLASAEALFLAGEGLVVQERIRLDVNARRVSGMSASSWPGAVDSSRRRVAR